MKFRIPLKKNMAVVFIVFLLGVTFFFLKSVKPSSSDTYSINVRDIEHKSNDIYISENTIWNLSSSPYYINETYIIESGVTLTIEPGVEVLFNGFFSIIVEGALNATGTSANPIFFSSNKTIPQKGDWDSLNFTESSSKSILRNVNISYADIGIQIRGGIPSIINNTIYENNYGVLSFNLSAGDLIIENNTIFNSKFNNLRVQDLSGNNVNYYIRNNKMFNSSYSYEAIDLRPDGVSQIIFENNDIYDNAGSGVRIAYCDLSNLIFQNNSIYNNKGTAIDRFGVGFKDIRFLNPFFIQYNKIYNNSNHGVFIEDIAGYPCCNRWLEYFYFQFNNIYNNLNDGVYSSQHKANSMIFRLNRIYNNTNNGLSIVDDLYNFKSLYVQNNEIYNNSNGLYMTYWVEDAYTIENNNIYNNSNYAIDCGWEEPLKTIRAKQNWWGTNESSEIDNMIYDYFDNNSIAKIEYNPFLNNSVIETFNGEPPQYNNFIVNDTTIYPGDYINISIDVFDNNNISYVWIEIDANSFFLTNIQNTTKYYFIFIPTEVKVYYFTIYFNDSSGIISSFSSTIIVLRVNDTDDAPILLEPLIITIIIISYTIAIVISSLYIRSDKDKMVSRKKKKNKGRHTYLHKKETMQLDKIEIKQKVKATKQAILEGSWRSKDYVDSVDINKKVDEGLNVMQIFKEENTLKKLLSFEILNITILTEDFLEKIDMFEWDINEKEEFIKDMLALSPNQRETILKRMFEKSNPNQNS